MSFADRIASTAGRPGCWGSRESFDPDDSDCQECNFQHSCRQEVNARRTGVPLTQIRTGTPSSYRPYAQNDTPGWTPGLTYEGENPFARIMKDGAVGAMRGMFHEWWRFMTNFRIR